MDKKATFVLDEKLLELIKELIKENYFKSMKNFVETAIRNEIKRIKERKIKEAIIDASYDHLFLSDLNQIQEDFKDIDFEEDCK